MNTKRLKELVCDPRFISGIYNYCDRWCERCPMSARCLNYAMEKEEEPTPEERDLNNAAFWKRMHETFQATMELLKESAAERGINLDAIMADEETKTEERRERRRERRRSRHPLATASFSYIGMVNKWFESNKALFDEKEIELNTKARLELKGSAPKTECDSIVDAVEVIRWYQHFIHVKLMRGLDGDARPPIEELKDFPKDSDGSAKIALIALDRSIAAWGRLRELLPNDRDSILDLLVHLDRIRKAAEAKFPQARAFQRPGFDYIPKPES